MKNILFISFILCFISTTGYCQKESKYTVFKTNSNFVYDICFSNNGNSLAVTDNNTIKIFSISTQEKLKEFSKGHNAEIRAIDISNNDSILVSGDKDGRIVVWDFINNKILKTLTYHKGDITSVDISPDGRFLVSGGIDNKMYLYDLKNNSLLHEFNDHSDDVTSVGFSPDGKLLASASGDKTIKIYELSNYKLLASLTGHKSWVRGIAFSSDSKKLISCGDDSRIITWNLNQKDNIAFQNETVFDFEWLLSIDFNIDNNTYACSGMNGKARIITPIGLYYLNVGKPINKIKFKPNEKYYLIVAVATLGNGVIYLEGTKMKFKD